MKSLIIIISNPAAKKASPGKIETASAFLRKKGFDTLIFFTNKRGDAEHLASEIIKQKPYLIIAAGGDGTINEVINGIANSKVPLAILPLGTTNVLAKELGIPENIRSALEIAISKTPRTVSLGKIVLNSTATKQKNHYLQHPMTISRYFCLMAGIGFDGKTVSNINVSLKKFSGKIAYILSGIINLLSYSPNELFFNIDGKEYSGYAAIIGKAGKYGGNFSVTPDAKLTEPALYACIFKGRQKRDIITYVFQIIKGVHLKNKSIIYTKAEKIEIFGSSHIQTDGDYVGTSPARISVEKNSLRLVY